MGEPPWDILIPAMLLGAGRTERRADPDADLPEGLVARYTLTQHDWAATVAAHGGDEALAVHVHTGVGDDTDPAIQVLVGAPQAGHDYGHPPSEVAAQERPHVVALPLGAVADMMERAAASTLPLASITAAPAAAYIGAGDMCGVRARTSDEDRAAYKALDVSLLLACGLDAGHGGQHYDPVDRARWEVLS